MTAPVLARDPRAYALLMAATLTIMSNATISPALPQIEELFHDTPNAALMTRLLITVPSLMVAVAAPFAGMLADRLGRRPQVLAGAVIFAAAGTAGLWLDTLTGIMVSRLVLGIAVAAIMTAQSALAGDYYPPAVRSRFLGYQMATAQFGGLAFILLAGWLASHSARLPFAIYGVVLPMLPLFWAVLRDVPRAAPGAVAAQGEEGGWLMPVMLLALLAALTFALMYIVPTQMPYYMRDTGHGDPGDVGLVMAGTMLAGGLAATFYGRAMRLLGPVRTPAAGYAAMAAGFVILSQSSGLVVLAAGALCVGAGVGSVMPTFVASALSIAPPHRRGTAAGIITTSIFLGQFASPFFSLPLIRATGYAETFVITGAILACIGVVVLIGFGRMPRSAAAR